MDDLIALLSYTSIEDSDLTEHVRLSDSLRIRFESTGRATDLDAAIGHQVKAILLGGETHVDYGLLLNSLGALLVQRFVRTGSLLDIQNAIRYQQKALDCFARGSPSSAVVLDKLGLSLRRRYERLGEQQDIDTAIKYQEQAVDLVDDDDMRKGGILNNLGNSLSLRYERRRDPQDIERAIQAQTRCVEVTPEDFTETPKYLNNLGNSFWRRCQFSGSVDDLDSAIKYRQQAVSLSSEDYPEKHRFMNNLGVALLGRFERLGDLNDLLQAMRCHEEVLRLRPAGHADRATPLNNLGLCFWRQYQHTGYLTHVDQAISYQQEAIQFTPVGHARRPGYLVNLATTLLERYVRLYDRADLDRAVTNLRQSVPLLANNRADKARAWLQLGHAYRFSFQQSADKSDIDNALKFYQLSASLISTNRLNNIHALDGLGSSYLVRYYKFGRADDLDEAIAHYHNTLGLAPDKFTGLLLLMTNLGTALVLRFKHSDNLSDINESVKCYEQAISIVPEKYPSLSGLLVKVGYAFETRFERLGDAQDFDRAISYFEQAAKADTSPAPSRLEGVHYWIKLLAQRPNDGLVLEAYQLAMSFLPDMVWQGMSMSWRYKSVAFAGNFTAGAAAAAVASGRYDLALEWLEQGRSVIWKQMIQLRQPIDAVHIANPVIARQYETVIRELEATANLEKALVATLDDPLSLEVASQKQRRLAEQWQGLVKYFIRQVPGFEDFLKPRRFAELVDAACKVPLVMVNIHETRCDALALLTNKRIIHIPLPSYSHEKATRAYNRWVANLKHLNVRNRGVRRDECINGTNDRSPFARILTQLWEEVARPILEALGFMEQRIHPNQSPPRLTWCTTGPLSFLPIHAAGNYDSVEPPQRVFDYVVSSYIPSISSLLQQSQSPMEFHGILAIGQEDTPDKAPLPFVSEEIKALQNVVPGTSFTSVTGSSATVDKVLTEFPNHSWVHFACHASQNPQDPNASGFFLQDGKLDLAAISAQPSKNAKFAYLSACETATGDTGLPDEAVHLTAGMLVAGFRSVIGTMWSIKDEHGPVVAERVYAELLKDKVPEHERAAEALHKAVAHLRDMVGEEKYEEWASFIHVGA